MLNQPIRVGRIMPSETTSATSPTSVTETTLLLQRQIEEEKRRNRQLTESINQLRHSTASLLDACEKAQEGISNRLMREIERLKASQLEMCQEVEEGEARVVEMLECRIRELQKDKVNLEVALECEQERIVNKLQRQMEELRISAGLVDHQKSNSPNLSAAVRSDGEIISKNNSPKIELQEQIQLSVAQHMRREAELQQQVNSLQEQNQTLALENLTLKNKLRRMGVEESVGGGHVSDSPSFFSHSPPSRSRSRGSISELRRSSIGFPSDIES